MLKLTEEEAKVRLGVIKEQFKEWFGRSATDHELLEMLKENRKKVEDKFIESYIWGNDYQQTEDLISLLANKVPSNEQTDTATDGKESKRRAKGNHVRLGESGDVFGSDPV